MTIPESVSCIGSEAFNNCPALHTVTVPANVADIGDMAFGYCLSFVSEPPQALPVEGFTIRGYRGTAAQRYAQSNGFAFTDLDPLQTTDPTPAAQDDAFTDVPAQKWYSEAVAWAVGNGITKGTSGTTFSPDQVCTRAQVVTFLWRASGCPMPSKEENPFTDVDERAFYYRAVLWAVENGITGGTTPTTFSSNDPCTRAQVVTFLFRYESAE